MQKQNVITYIEKIDAAYTEGKLKGWSRLSDEWSEFSAPFNRAIRKLIKDDVPESPLLQMILPYWFNRSEMLEIHYSKKHKIKRGTLRRLKKQCDSIRKDISRGRVNEIGQLSMDETARRAIQGAT